MDGLQSSNLSDPTLQDKSTWRTFYELTHATQENTTLHTSRSNSSNFLVDLNITLWRVIPPLFLIFGTYGNVMTVLVMRGMRASPSTACLSIYFTALAVSDQFVLIPAVTYFWVYFGFAWPPFLFRFNILCSVPKLVWNVAAITSAWFLVALTYQRVTSVVAPHRVGVLCTVRRGKIIVATIVFISFAFHFHFLFTWVYYPEFEECYYQQKYIYLVEYFEWQSLLCYAACPFLFLIIGNSVLIWQVIKSVRISREMRAIGDQQATSRDDKVHSMSVTLIITSTAYLIFTLPTCLFDVYMKTNTLTFSSDVISLVRTYTIFSWFSSMSTNFYLYLLSGNKFRQEAKRYLCCRESDLKK